MKSGFGNTAVLLETLTVNMGDVNATAKDKVDEMIKSNKVLLIIKKTCPYSIKARKILDEHMETGEYRLWDISSLANMDSIQDYINSLTGGRTVPRLFIDKKFIGGCDDVEKLKKDGKLMTMLSPWINTNGKNQKH